MNNIKLKALIKNKKTGQTDWRYYTTLEKPNWLSNSDYKVIVKDLMFTGKYDINGVMIWEHDIVRVNRQDSLSSFNKAVIIYSETYASFMLMYTKRLKDPKGIIAQESITSEDGKTIFDYCTGWELTVIKNAHE